MAPRKFTRGRKKPDDDIIMPEEIPTAVKETVTPYVITSDQYDDLWEAFHGTRSDEVSVDRKALVAALQDYGSQPGGLVLEEGRRNSKYVTCAREALWGFLRELGKMYGEWDRKLQR